MSVAASCWVAQCRSYGAGMSVARCRLIPLFVGLVAVPAACSDDGDSAYDFSEVSCSKMSTVSR